MGIMCKTKKITVEGLGELTVSELTGEQVDQLVNRDNTGRPFYVMEAMLDTALPIEAVSMATGLEAEKLNAMPPSAAERIWQAVVEVNPFLSRMLEKFKPTLEDIAAAAKRTVG